MTPAVLKDPKASATKTQSHSENKREEYVRQANYRSDAVSHGLALCLGILMAHKKCFSSICSCSLITIIHSSGGPLMTNFLFSSRRILALAAILALFFTLQQSAQAQGMRRSPEERAKQMKERLTLNDEQTKELTKILEDQQKEMMGMMGSFQGDREAAQKAMQELTAKIDKKIEKLLDKEQIKKYEEFKKERAQMRRGRPQ